MQAEEGLHPVAPACPLVAAGNIWLVDMPPQSLPHLHITSPSLCVFFLLLLWLHPLFSLEHTTIENDLILGSVA